MCVQRRRPAHRVGVLRDTLWRPIDQGGHGRTQAEELPQTCKPQLLHHRRIPNQLPTAWAFPVPHLASAHSTARDDDASPTHPQAQQQQAALFCHTHPQSQ